MLVFPEECFLKQEFCGILTDVPEKQWFLGLLIPGNTTKYKVLKKSCKKKAFPLLFQWIFSTSSQYYASIYIDIDTYIQYIYIYIFYQTSINTSERTTVQQKSLATLYARVIAYNFHLCLFNLIQCACDRFLSHFQVTDSTSILCSPTTCYTSPQNFRTSWTLFPSLTEIQLTYKIEQV